MTEPTPVIRHRRALIISGGLAGAIIGPAGFWTTTHGGAGVAAVARRWHTSELDVVFGSSVRLLECGWGALVSLVLGLVTLAPMPTFLRWLAAGLTWRPARVLRSGGARWRGCRNRGDGDRHLRLCVGRALDRHLHDPGER